MPRSEGCPLISNLKQMGMPVSDIIKATGLSPDEIEKL